MQEPASPTLLLSEEICRANIHRMAKKAKDNDLTFKPHMKTHQSAEVGRWIQEAGAKAITVSSVKMAQYFADAGWKNITIAFPVNLREIQAINDLAGYLDLTLLVNQPEVAEMLNNELRNSVQAYIEIDSGSRRTGLRTDQKPEINKLIKAIQKTERIHWVGFYSHPGHSYQARSEDEILSIHRSVESQCEDLQSEFGSYAASKFEICVGDTPCCSVATSFSGMNAISPGNFVFYDVMQHQIGSCDISDIAVAVACPVVDRYPDRNELIIHGGAVHFSKEKSASDNFGLAGERVNNHWQIAEPNVSLSALSQEHGVLQTNSSEIAHYNIGDVIHILPVHSCLTANLIKEFLNIKSGQNISMMTY